MIRPIIYISDVLRWADAHRKQTGRWPTRNSGPVAGESDLTWQGINVALGKGNRGLSKGSTLPQLLAQHRGVRNRGRLPKFTIRQILAWADAYHQRTGNWPTQDSGAIPEMAGETWRHVARALSNGRRGLPGGSSLARLLAKRRGVRNLGDLPNFTKKEVLGWADAFRRRHGRWPRKSDEAIPESPGETWQSVAEAFYRGIRGLPRSSLAAFLARHRGVRYRLDLPDFSIKQILVWAESHRRRTGRWPKHTSGAIADAPGETWSSVHQALRSGYRGLPGGSSLYRLKGERPQVERSGR